MSFSNTEISQKVLEMPMKDRAALVDRIFDSIDSELENGGQEGRERRWAEESEKRIDAVERGELKTVDGEAALARFRRMLQK